jgi:gluconate 2-dehydrogenase gamma chain
LWLDLSRHLGNHDGNPAYFIRFVEGSPGMAKDVGRRSFLTQVAVVGTAASVGISPAIAAATPSAPAAQQPSATSTKDGYTFLAAPEAAFVEALVDVIVPADDLTPSGTALGLATFIDRQLAGAWGNGARMYRNGPFLPSKP